MTADRLASVIGETKAYRLISAKAGKRLYVPKSPGGIIRGIIGQDAEQKLIDAFGGEYIRIPVAKAWRFDRMGLVT